MTALGWYFFLWSLGGLHYQAWGPYETQQVCEEQRLVVKESVKSANHISSDCSYLTIHGGGVK